MRVNTKPLRLLNVLPPGRWSVKLPMFHARGRFDDVKCGRALRRCLIVDLLVVTDIYRRRGVGTQIVGAMAAHPNVAFMDVFSKPMQKILRRHGFKFTRQGKHVMAYKIEGK